MPKKVTENHTVIPEGDESNFEFEDMAGVGKTDEAVDTETKPNEANEAVDTETKSDEAPETKSENKTDKGKSNIIILKKAASYSGCGLKFLKNEPTPVEDKAIYDKLLSTGLFVKG